MNQIICRQPDQVIYQNLLDNGADPFLSKLYAARPIQSHQEIEHGLALLLPYQTMKNIEPMAERLYLAISKQEKITIVADYDTDGATACALGILALRTLGGQVNYVVPNRFEHGYGLTESVVDLVMQDKPDIILTVDNGIASLNGIAYAQQLGIEVLVTDHHLPAQTLPDCLIVNPNQPGCLFPSKNLAGVGVLFYVLIALRALLRAKQYFTPTGNIPEPNLGNWLDLVALGTVADVVTLDHNNRILIAQGLKRIHKQPVNKGIQALFSVAKRNPKKAETFDLGFAIAPRINAAGRLDDMGLGIQCLLAPTEMEASTLAQTLDQMNRDRRSIEKEIHQEALALVQTEVKPDQYSIVASEEHWHEGVIGIVASRLKEHFHRPAIVFAATENGELKGSGRSISGFHLRDGLDWISKQNSELILKFGGHAMAAGLTIKADNLPLFNQLFEQSVKLFTPEEKLQKAYTTDGILEIEEITLDNALKIRDKIWGQGFAFPTFVDEFSVSWQRLVGKNHKKVGLIKSDTVIEAMLFNCTEDLPAKIKAVYRLVANEWREQYELQLYIDHWQAC